MVTVLGSGVDFPVMRLILLLLPALVACGAQDSRPSPGVRKERQAAAEAAVSKTPVPRTYRYGDGELMVLDIPSANGSGFVESQRCFVWRDMELKTSSLSCPGPSDLFPALDPPR